MDTPNVTEKKDEEKKKAGFLANLVGKPGAGAGGIPGLGGAGGAGGFGGFGGLGGLFAGGGLLATKAGLIGALLVASAVAGALGLIGYKVFGPSGADKIGSGFSLFAARPVDEQRKIEAERAAADGKSASLDFLVKANAGAQGGAQASDAQAVEAVGASPTDAQAAAGAAGAVPAKNSGDVSGNKAGKLGAGSGKFGSLAKMSLSGGGGAGASMSAAGAPVRASGGRLSAMPAGARGSGAGARGLARGLGGRGALSQLRGVRNDHRGAASSMAAGSTYDGGPRAIGAAGTTAGAGDGGPAADAAGSPNDMGMVNGNFPDPPKPESSGWSTPWEAATKTAAAAIMAGVVLLVLAAKLKKIPGYGTALALACAAAAALAGALAISMGNMIAGGEFGQKLQGGMFVAAGTGLMVSGGLMMIQSTLATPNAILAKLMVLSGAMAIGAALVGTLTPLKKQPPWKFEGGRAPDWDHRDSKSGQGGQGTFFGLGRDKGAWNDRSRDRNAWLKTQLPC